MCNSEPEPAASSRLLDCTNSPETRLARVSLLLDQESIFGCLCFPSLFRTCCMICHIFLFLDPISPSPPSISFFLLVSVCTHTRLFYLLWRLCSTSSCQKKSPPLPFFYAVVLLMVFLMVADGLREPLALGLGVQRAFNKSQSVLCHYINIFGQLLWRSGGAASHQSPWSVGTGETSAAANTRKRKRRTQEIENPPAYLQA